MELNRKKNQTYGNIGLQKCGQDPYISQEVAVQIKHLLASDGFMSIDLFLFISQVSLDCIDTY